MLDHQAPGELRQRDREQLPLARDGLIERDLHSLPDDLPVPEDDGACDHLAGERLPEITLPSTEGDGILLSELVEEGTVVLFIYPRTGRPSEDPLPGWDLIPGARGCTPQSCAFRDLRAEFERRGVRVIGLSAQEHPEQLEFAGREGITFPLLSDPLLELAAALRLPTFEAGPMQLYKRVTLVVKTGVIAKVFYPVFPPDRNAEEVLAWLDGAGGVA